MTNPNTARSTGKDKSTPIGIVSNSLDEDAVTDEVSADQGAEETSPDAAEQSEE
jgi:hypothetical protein